MIVNYLLITTSFLLLNTTISYALYAYDCAADGLNVTSLSLLEVEECPEYITKDVVNSVYVQVLQQRETYDVQTYRCSIHFTYRVTHCGMHSHVSRVSNGEGTKIWSVSAAECREIHKTRQVRIFGKTIQNLKLNSTETKHLVIAGSTNFDGQCTGSYLNIGDHQWNSVYGTAEVSITLQDFTSLHRVNDNKLITPGGVTCPFMDGACTDVELGFLTWNKETRKSCDRSSYHVLYTGLASKIIITEQSTANPTYTLYSIKSGNFLATLVKVGDIDICNMAMHTTDHSKLLIQEVTNGVKYFSENTIPAKDMDLFLYVNAKFTHLERHSRRELTRLYSTFMKEICEVKRHSLRTLLTIASIDPMEFAYTYMGKPGYTALLMGEVVNIVQCKPVYATVAHVDTCYMELPVNYTNKLYFMTPKSHIIQRTGTPLTCTMFMQPSYRLESKWFASSTQVVMTRDPSRMSIGMKPTWVYTDAGDLAKAGVYSEDDLTRLRSQIMYPAERKAITQVISAAINEDSVVTDASMFKNLITREALEKSVNNFFGSTWSHFISLGTFFSGIFGIMLVFKLTKILFDTIVNARGLYEVYGFGWHMVAGIWDAATTYLLSPKHVWKYQQKEESKQPPIYELTDRHATAPEQITNFHSQAIDPLYPRISVNHQQPAKYSTVGGKVSVSTSTTNDNVKPPLFRVSK